MTPLICVIFLFQSKCVQDSETIATDKKTNVQKDGEMSVRSQPNEVQISEDIAADYYYGKEGLRSDPSYDNCTNPTFQLWCHVQCGGDHLCVKGECFCLKLPVGSKGLSSLVTKADSPDLSPHFGDDDDYENEPGSLYPLNVKSALRHQIAHFCPNLDIARECITTCMQQGKPAFCGKDHRCYCGHRDVHTLNAGKKVDAYKQYQDMYKKYLGIDVAQFG